MLRGYTLPKLRAGGKLIIIGDVHGCRVQLDALLVKAEYRRSSDVVLLIGDLVNKGPDSIGVVQRVMELGAISLLGNHDSALLNAVDHFKATGEVDRADPQSVLAARFPEECTRHLRKLPHYVEVPEFGVLCIHAGLEPGKPVREQTLWALLNMRSIDGGKPSDSPKGEPWAKSWDGAQTVVFGHDARRGLQEYKNAIGLDSGCCYGKALTAVVFPGRRLVSVPGHVGGAAKKPAAVALAQLEARAGRDAAAATATVPSAAVAAASDSSMSYLFNKRPMETPAPTNGSSSPAAAEVMGAAAAAAVGSGGVNIAAIFQRQGSGGAAAAGADPLSASRGRSGPALGSPAPSDALRDLQLRVQGANGTSSRSTPTGLIVGGAPFPSAPSGGAGAAMGGGGFVDPAIAGATLAGGRQVSPSPASMLSGGGFAFGDAARLTAASGINVAEALGRKGSAGQTPPPGAFNGASAAARLGTAATHSAANMASRSANMTPGAVTEEELLWAHTGAKAGLTRQEYAAGAQIHSTAAAAAAAGRGGGSPPPQASLDAQQRGLAVGGSPPTGVQPTALPQPRHAEAAPAAARPPGYGRPPGQQLPKSPEVAPAAEPKPGPSGASSGGAAPDVATALQLHIIAQAPVVARAAGAVAVAALLEPLGADSTTLAEADESGELHDALLEQAPASHLRALAVELVAALARGARDAAGGQAAALPAGVAHDLLEWVTDVAVMRPEVLLADKALLATQIRVLRGVATVNQAQVATMEVALR